MNREMSKTKSKDFYKPGEKGETEKVEKEG